MKLIKALIGLIIIFFCSCHHDEFDARYAAKNYCECMKKNGAPEEYAYARKICDAELLKDNQYFRLFEIDMVDNKKYYKIPRSLRDSAQKFNLELLRETKKECCYQILYCDRDTVKK